MAVGVLDEDAFFAVGSGVADDEVEVGVSIDVTEGGVGGRVVDRGEVVRGSALNRALPLLREYRSAPPPRPWPTVNAPAFGR
jgi:hypothetical protein